MGIIQFEQKSTRNGGEEEEESIRFWLKMGTIPSSMEFHNKTDDGLFFFLFFKLLLLLTYVQD